MTYPVTRMVHVLESAGCTNSAAGAVALIEDQHMVKALIETFKDLPEPGTPMTAAEREWWKARFRLFLDAYVPVSDEPELLAIEARIAAKERR